MKPIHEFKPQQPLSPIQQKLQEQKPQFRPPLMPTPAKRSHAPIGHLQGRRSS